MGGRGFGKVRGKGETHNPSLYTDGRYEGVDTMLLRTLAM